MTPTEALEVLRREHTPYVPKILDVLDEAGWRAPTLDEQVESDLWCDACNRAAERCTVATVLALVDMEATR